MNGARCSHPRPVCAESLALAEALVADVDGLVALLDTTRGIAAERAVRAKAKAIRKTSAELCAFQGGRFPLSFPTGGPEFDAISRWYHAEDRLRGWLRANGPMREAEARSRPPVTSPPTPPR